MSYVLLLEDSIINKRFLSPQIHHPRINFFNESGMEMECEKREKPYKIPDNAITCCAYKFVCVCVCVCLFCFVLFSLESGL